MEPVSNGEELGVIMEYKVKHVGGDGYALSIDRRGASPLQWHVIVRLEGEREGRAIWADKLAEAEARAKAYLEAIQRARQELK